MLFWPTAPVVSSHLSLLGPYFSYNILTGRMPKMKKFLFVLFALSMIIPALGIENSSHFSVQKEQIEKAVASLPSSLTLVKNFDTQDKAVLPLVAALNIVHISFVQIPKLIGKKALQMAIHLKLEGLQKILLPIVLSKEELSRIKTLLDSSSKA